MSTTTKYPSDLFIELGGLVQCGHSLPSACRELGVELRSVDPCEWARYWNKWER